MTTREPRQFVEQVEDASEAHRKRNTFRVSLALFGAFALYDGPLLYIASQTGAWQLSVHALSVAAGAAIQLLALMLIRRDHPKLGIPLMIGTYWSLLLTMPFLINGLGVLLLVGPAISISAIASLALKREQASRVILAAILVGVTALLIDLYYPQANRFGRPFITTFATLNTVVMVPVFIFLVARQFKNFSLNAKLIISVVAASVLSVMAVGVFAERITRAALLEDANQTLLAAASQTATSLDTFIKFNLDAVRSEAQLPILTQYLGMFEDQRSDNSLQTDVEATLQALSRKDLVHISSYALLDQTGTVLFDTLATGIGTTETERDYFLQPRESGLPYVSPVQFVEGASGAAGIYFSSPVQDAVGDTIGVLRVRYDVTILQQHIAQSADLAGDGSFAILLDENYLRLAHGTQAHLNFTTVVPLDAAKIATLKAAARLPDLPPDQLSTDLPDLAEALDNMDTQPLFTGEIGVVETDAADATEHLEQAAIATLEKQPWLVVYAQSQDVFFAPAQEQARSTVVLAIVIAGVMATAAYALAQLLSRPILRLTAVAEQVSTGDLNAQAQIDTRDEIGTLATAFNGMTSKLAQSMEGLEQHVVELKLTKEQLITYSTELERSNRELQSFASVASHDLQEPLRKIQAFSDRLQTRYGKDLNPEARDYLKRMQDAAGRMQSLINDLLVYSRVTTKARPFAPVELTKIVQDVLSDLEVHIEQTGAHVNLEDLPTIEADPLQMRQLMQNLISNSLKFHRDGKPPVINIRSTFVNCPESDTAASSPHNGCCQIILEDNGIGFDEKYLDRVFGLFQRLHGRSAYQGTGMGLAICHKIVERHAGAITARSMPDQGATFIITLPIHQTGGGELPYARNTETHDHPDGR